MRISIIAVGKPGRLLAGAIDDYEQRAARYWKLESVAVKPETASRNRPVTEVMAAEAERLLGAVGPGADVVALTRSGRAWSSRRLARYLDERAIRAGGDVGFVIGGAFGLHDSVLDRAAHRLSLSTMTLPHDLARLLLAEQIYRAGTIVRGEPYHKD